MINKELLKILICPVCKADIRLEKDIIICDRCKEQFPIKDGIPIMIIKEEARR